MIIENFMMTFRNQCGVGCDATAEYPKIYVFSVCKYEKDSKFSLC